MAAPRIAQNPLKIVIVGGVAGGMSAATRARRLNEVASITVFEQGPFISFANCGLPYTIGEEVIKNDSKLLLHSPESIKRRFNVDVEINSVVTHIDRLNHIVHVTNKDSNRIREVPYDKCILAQGAEPWQPPIKGLNAAHVFSLQTVPDLRKINHFLNVKNPKHVAVIGGGFIGLEAAENLRSNGLQISIVEYAPQVFAPVDYEIASRLHSEIHRLNVPLHLNARFQSVIAPCEKNEGAVTLDDGTSIPADMVLVVTGSRSRVGLAKAIGLELCERSDAVAVNPYMQTSDPDIYAVGDMVATYNRISFSESPLLLAGPANRQGRLAADHIFGRRASYKGNVGTSICKVFGLTVGCVGLSVRALRNLAKTPEYITVHPPHHASYYPDAANMTLRLVFDRMTGKILGAQAVGKAGIDKRIDVLATAMQAEMNVFDLEELELGYAPPYGSAKDAVNMAGFVAGNVIRGDVKILHAEYLEREISDGSVIVDVRSRKEFEGGHVTTTVNIPIDELRERIGELDSSKRTIVYCQVGYRGYLAYRILSQNGFEKIFNLDGGYKEVFEGGYRHLTTTGSDQTKEN